jgi:uncharacterized protein (DUF2141 family)
MGFRPIQDHHITANSEFIIIFVCFFCGIVDKGNLVMAKVVFVFMLSLVLLFTNFVNSADNKSSNYGRIIVEVEGFENSKGVLRSHLYSIDRKEYFPVKTDFCLMRDTALIKNNRSQVMYDNLPFGSYALTVHHDENANGTMDTDFFGLPDEGFGISMNPTILFSVPNFEEAQFDLKEKLKKITVKMKY